MQQGAPAADLAEAIVLEAARLQQESMESSAFVITHMYMGDEYGLTVVTRNAAGGLLLVPWPDVSRALPVGPVILKMLSKRIPFSTSMSMYSMDRKQLRAWSCRPMDGNGDIIVTTDVTGGDSKRFLGLALRSGCTIDYKQAALTDWFNVVENMQPCIELSSDD